MLGNYNPVGKDLEDLLCTVPAVRISFVRHGDEIELFATVGNSENCVSAREVGEFSPDQLWSMLKAAMQSLSTDLSTLSNERLEVIAEDSVFGMHFHAKGEPSSRGGAAQPSPSLSPTSPSALGSSYLSGAGSSGVTVKSVTPQNQYDAVQAALDSLTASAPVSLSSSSPVQQDSSCNKLPPEVLKRIKVISLTL